MNRYRMIFKNSTVVIFFLVVNTILGFLEVRVFLSTYGPEVNGLIQTGKQVLGYLTLLEGGICAAFLYKLYKPIAEKDYLKVSSLYKGFNVTIKNIVYKMLGIAIILCLIYPLFLNNKYGYVMSNLKISWIFILLSLRVILPFRFSSVPKYMIVLKEKNYIVETINGFSKLLQFTLEILLILILKPEVHIVLLIMVIISIITGLTFRKVMHKMYKGEIQKDSLPDDSPKSLSRDVFAHNLSALVFNSTDNIVLSFFSLRTVTIYSSYNLVVQKVNELITKLIKGISATLSLKIAKDVDRSFYIFRELQYGVYFIIGVIFCVFTIMINDFITMWIGSSYVLKMIDVTLFASILYYTNILPVLYIPRNAKGLYKESKKFTIVQAVLNLSITLVLVPIIGIRGALLGTFISRFFITVPFNHKLVFDKVYYNYRVSYFEVLLNYGLSILVTLIIKYAVGTFDFEITILSFMVKTIIVATLAIIINGFILTVVSKSFRMLLERLFKNFKRKQ